MRPYGVHKLRDVFGGPEVASQLPNGKYGVAVCEPYHGSLRERARAAWWVLTGRAYALVWPKNGELEQVLHGARGL